MHTCKYLHTRARAATPEIIHKHTNDDSAGVTDSPGISHHLYPQHSITFNMILMIFIRIYI